MIDQERINTRKCGSVFPSNGPETESILTTTLQQLQQVNTTLTLAPEDAATGGNLCVHAHPMIGTGISVPCMAHSRLSGNIVQRSKFNAWLPSKLKKFDIGSAYVSPTLAYFVLCEHTSHTPVDADSSGGSG